MRAGCVLVFLGVLVPPGAAAGQEAQIPPLTRAGVNAVNALVAACEKAEAVHLEGKGEAAVLRVDEKKLRAVVAERRKEISADLLNGLAERGFNAHVRYRAAAVSMLRACAEEKKDEHFLGVADFLGAKLNELALRLEEAARGYRATEKRFARAKEPAWQAVCWNNIGAVLVAQGDYDAALDVFRRTLGMFQVLYPKDKFPQGHANLAESLNNLGMVLNLQGEYAQALDHYRRAQRLAQALFPKEKFPQGSLVLAGCLNNLGALLQKQGEYTQALDHFRQALRMLQALYPKEQFPQGHIHVAITLNNLGIARKEQSEYARALARFRQAQRMFADLFPKDKYPQGHPYLATSLVNIGYVLDLQGEYAQSLDHFRQAHEMFAALYPRKNFPQGHPELAVCLNNLGSVLQDLGEYARARDHYLQALQMLGDLYPKDKYPHGHPHAAGASHNLGLVLLAQGKHAEAMDHFRRSLAIWHHELDRLASSAPEDRALNFAASLPQTRDGVLAAAALVMDSAATAYAAVWPGRSALTRVYQRRHLALLTASASPRVKRLYDLLLALQRQRTQLLLTPLLRNPQARDRRLAQLNADIEKADQELLPLLPALARSRRLAASTPTQLQKALPERTAFVDLLRYVRPRWDPKVKGEKGKSSASHYVAFVLTRGRLARVDLGEAKPIEEALALWRRALDEDSAAADKHGARVRRLAWDRLAGELKGSDTVYLSPDAALTRLPWAALPGDKPDTVLLERLRVAVVPHGAFLLDSLTAPRPEATRKPVLLAVGGVRYADRPAAAAPVNPERAPPVADKKGLKWDYLKGTEQELNRLRALAGRREGRFLTGAEAGARRVLQELPGATVAHLATHGFFADPQFRSALQLDEKLFERRLLASGEVGERIGAGARSPLVLSGLVLTGANLTDTPGRGILTADDLTRLDLRRLDLAVLSACESGLGEAGGGEGVYGLARAFHMAGCRDVVASLWKVNDEATAALMGLFYSYLWEKKLPPVEALRQAQLALYHNPGKVKDWSRERRPNLSKVYTGSGKAPAGVTASGKAHPKLWAAFTLSGLGR
jgi:CHAT domain-containing protein/Tfp pilus assembly protein PilF